MNVNTDFTLQTPYCIQMGVKTHDNLEKPQQIKFDFHIIHLQFYGVHKLQFALENCR